MVQTVPTRPRSYERYDYKVEPDPVPAPAIQRNANGGYYVAEPYYDPSNPQPYPTDWS